MDTYNVLGSLKLQSYLNNQNVSDETMKCLDTLSIKNLMTSEEFTDIQNKVQRYRTLGKENMECPSSTISAEMQELAQDVMYSTGMPVQSINLNDFKTDADLMSMINESDARSKNDLFVVIDYDDYSSTSNFIKCNVVGHDEPYAYGISANARMVVTKSGKIITTKNALYMK